MNTNADALSWNNMAVFFSQVPWAAKDPRLLSLTGIPQ